MAYDQSQINQIFQSSIGRQGTDAEHKFFQPYVDAGTISPYQIGQYLQSTPEAMQSRLGQQQNQFGAILGQNNQQILGQAADAANASFAQNGRQFSSGQGNAVLQAGQQLASQQSPTLAAFYGQGQNALNNNFMSQGQDALSRAYNLSDSNTAYQRQQAFYNQQQNDYNNYLGGQQTRNMQGALFNAGVSLPGQLLGAAGQAKQNGGGATGFGALFSDVRLKKDIEPIGKAGPLTIYSFEYRDNMGIDLPKGRRAGFLAHEVEAVHPEAVSVDRGFKKVDYGYLQEIL